MNPRIRRKRFDRPRFWQGARSSLPAEGSRRVARRPTSNSELSPHRPVSRSQPPLLSDDHQSADTTAPGLLEAVLDSFTTRWKNGEPVRAEDYTDQVPPSALAELIYHEYCLAEADCLDPDPGDYLRRFPDYSESLTRLFSLHDALSIATLRQMIVPSTLPSVGDEIGPYRLLRELGRGAFARVFLAEQADLADRLVVLKVAIRASAEPTLLARARHANIVEVLRHTEADDGTLHLICLPFLGGATLGAVLAVSGRRARAGRPRLPRSGRRFLDDFDRASAPEYLSTGSTHPAREMITRLSYPQVLAWMIARLAEALDHAERRGVTHGDIKPSNILITADGTPMLFDFNLAVDWHAPADLDPGADLGGTLAYMAPERLQALGTPTNPAAPIPNRRQPDRHRADLYALGLVLAEALTGEPPAIPERRSDDPRQFASSLARSRAASFAQPAHRSWAISPALRSILARCLAPDPADRYARGSELAQDLDRWRSNRPLIFAPEPTRSSWSRRLRSFRVPLLALALTITAAAAVGWVAWSILQGTQHDQALAKLSYILDYTEGIFQTRKVGNWRSDSTEDSAELANRLLAQYNVAKDSHWRDRPDVQALPERERGELEVWMLEQILRRAVAYGDRPNSPEDYQRGLNLLNREIAWTPYAALIQQRDLLRERPGVKSVISPARTGPTATARKPAPWLDAYLLGVLAEPLHARQALGYYLDALKDRPDLFWGHYRAACAACRIDEYALAIKSLRICVDRRPKNERLRNVLASTMFSLGRYSVPDSALVNLTDAQAECDQAANLNPDFARATRTRAMISQLLGQTESTRGDLERFSLLSRLGRNTDSILLGVVTRTSPGEAFRPYSPSDEANLRHAIVAEVHNELAKTTLADGLVLAGRQAETIELYEGAIQDDPTHLNARFQRAIELAKAGLTVGYDELTDLVDHPRFEELYCIRPGAFRVFNYLTNNLLKNGQVHDAEVMIQRGWAAIRVSRALRDEVVTAKTRGLPQINVLSEMHYTSARVDVTAARTDPSRLTSAIDHLRKAFATNQAARREWFTKDRLFDSNREEILQQIETHFR